MYLKVEIMSSLLLCMRRRVLLGTVFGDDTRAHRVGVTSGFVSIWSEQSDGAGEASHTSLSAQREWRSEEGGRVRRRSGWEVCRWLITTHICSPHFLFPLIAYISSLFLLPSIIFSLIWPPMGSTSWCSFSWRRPTKRWSNTITHFVF